MNIPAHLLPPVAAWAIAEQAENFEDNGSGSRYGILQLRRLQPPPEVWVIKRMIVHTYGLHGAPLEPLHKDLCGYTPEGRWALRHKDMGHEGKKHTRFNVLVAKPEAGGNPVIDDVEVQVAEGEVWRCEASSVYHGTTTVMGSKPRIILSYGFLL